MTQDELLKLLKALEGRKLLGVEAFDDEHGGKWIDLYFDGKPQMFFRISPILKYYVGFEVGVMREMGPNYAMGSTAREGNNQAPAEPKGSPEGQGGEVPS